MVWQNHVAISQLNLFTPFFHSKIRSVSCKHDFDFLGPSKGGLFRKGSYMGQETLDQVKRGMMNPKWMLFICKGDEEIVDHILLHCKKEIMLWRQLIFALFGIE